MQSENKYRIVIESPYYYGDLIAFRTVMASGQGTIIGIDAAEDGSISYTVLVDDGTGVGGVFPENVQLLKSHSDSGKPLSQ